MDGGWIRLRAARAALLLGALGITGSASSARAYSSFSDYIRPIQEGGGGGRLFSGTPSDGYGCDVCHTGAKGAELQVIGLPQDGYVPGQSYEITLRWPETVPHVALMAELSDMRGQPLGTTSLLPYAGWQPGEICENNFPAGDLCRVGSGNDGCCRDLEPTRDACTLPGSRNVLWVLDCASRFARMVWTAPPVVAGDVWFSAEMVTSNLQNDVAGDGVTSVVARIRPKGTSSEVSAAVGECHASSPKNAPPPLPLAAIGAAILGTLWRRRRRAMNGNS